MDTKAAIQSQFLATLEMLKGAIEKCPAEIWADPEPKNKFWHMAFHALFFTHFYLHPTQVYMAVSNLFLFFLLVWVQKRKRFHGMVFLSYVMLYSVFRFIIEFFRGDFRGDFFFSFLSMSQGIGILVFTIALVLMVKQARAANADR